MLWAAGWLDLSCPSSKSPTPALTIATQLASTARIALRRATTPTRRPLTRVVHRARNESSSVSSRLSLVSHDVLGEKEAELTMLSG
jgi:hypothetical protein